MTHEGEAIVSQGMRMVASVLDFMEEVVRVAVRCVGRVRCRYRLGVLRCTGRSLGRRGTPVHTFAVILPFWRPFTCWRWWAPLSAQPMPCAPHTRGL